LIVIASMVQADSGVFSYLIWYTYIPALFFISIKNKNIWELFAIKD
jgi:hypothetical protein